MKKVFIIHGWGGYPKEGWFPWLKRELSKRGFDAKIPAMPDPDNPEIEKWVRFLAKLVKKADKDTYFVGHSIGCQAILRYLQTIEGKIGGAVFVGGWFTLKPAAMPTKKEKTTAKPWLETPIDFGRIQKKTKKITAIFSDNDPYVPLENQETFRKKLGAKIMIDKQKGHFSGEDEITELPVALDELLRMSTGYSSQKKQRFND